MLSVEAACRLKAEIFAGRSDVAGQDAAPSPVVVWKAGLSDLLILGATSNRAGAIPGALAGLFFFLGQELPRYLAVLQEGLFEILGVVSPALAGAAWLLARRRYRVLARQGGSSSPARGSRTRSEARQVNTSPETAARLQKTPTCV